MGRLLLLLRASLLLILVAAAPAILPGPVQAQGQDQTAPDYTSWNAFADRAEKIAGNPSATDAALNQLRGQVVDWRSKFQDAQNANKSRINTLQQQIAALGPVPKDGATEAPEIAQRRTELNDQLAKLQAPGLAADEAYSRADGIVRQIDQVIRERQAEALMHLGPSPLNPANWPAGLSLVNATVTRVGSEVADAWSMDNRRAELVSKLPLILLYIIVGAVLLARGRTWVERLARQLAKRLGVHGRQVVALVASLFQIMVPLLGLVAIVAALQVTGMTGPTGKHLLGVLLVIGAEVIFALWLGRQIFPKQDEAADPFLELSPEQRAEGRFESAVLGGLLGLDILRRTVMHAGVDNEAANAVLAFPIILLTGVALYRLGRLLRADATERVPQDETSGYRQGVIGLLGRTLMLASVVAPILGAIGYQAAAMALLFPAVVSLALIALLVIVQRLIDTIYQWVGPQRADGEGGLIPILAGFALTVLALPLFALIWGARVADLAELWTQFAQGFSIGSTRISPANFLTFVVLFAIGYGVTRLVQGALKTTVLPRTRIDIGGQNAIRVGVGYLGIVLAALIAITGAGIDLSGLALVASALTVGIGFGLQNIVSNFVSGIILLIERPVAEGDWIEAGGVQGTVRSISVRSTRIETFDRADVIVPNSNLITGTVTNMTKFSRIGRLIVPVGVAYGTDTRRVDAVLREIAEAHPLVVLNPKPQIIFSAFGADSLEFEMRVILRDINFVLDVKNELHHQIAERFKQEGFEIPFAQRDIWLRNPETLRDGVSPPPREGRVSAKPESRPVPDPGSEPRLTPEIDGEGDGER